MKKVKIILGLGILLITFSPFIFTRTCGIIDFTTTGQIGDTIGGITAPLTSLLGSILVFFALKAQIDANALIQNQINSQKKDDEIKKRNQYLYDNFKILREDINEFTITVTKRMRLGSKVSDTSYVKYKGSDAIDIVVSELKNINSTQYDLVFEGYLKLKELIILLKSIELFLLQIDNSIVSVDDKKYLKSLMKYQFTSKIKPSFEKNEKHKEKEILNKSGFTETSGIPNDLFSLIDKIEDKLN